MVMSLFLALTRLTSYGRRKIYENGGMDVTEG